MKTYLAALKPNVTLQDIRSKLSKEGITIAHFYPKLNVVKLESSKTISQEKFADYFISVEEEKTDFSDR